MILLGRSAQLADLGGMFQAPKDLQPLRTKDGSFTLFSASLNERYHSNHGGLNESLHVFIEAGMRHVQGDRMQLLEVGLGTGLNALLTWIEADTRRMQVTYTALEPHPVEAGLVRAMQHPLSCGAPEREADFLRMMDAPEGKVHRISEHFSFTRLGVPALAFEAPSAFDLIYYDAFGPAAHPEMWTTGMMAHMRSLLKPGGHLVTYCAKGDVGRAMKAAGLTIERLPGPPGKREMLRATRPSQP